MDRRETFEPNRARGRSALILGVTGQDGYYLSRLLLAQGYEVFGMVRDLHSRSQDLAKTAPNVCLVSGDVTDQRSLMVCIEQTNPHEIYNLAGLSSVGQSFESPQLTINTNFMGVARLLDAVRLIGAEDIRVFQASSSEMYGDTPGDRQGEYTALSPVSPYGVSKAAAHQLCRVYRDAYGLAVSCGILFNHESIHRPESFVTKKIAIGVAKIKLGLQGQLVLGNLDIRRDWGFAGDYVEAMHLMLQNPDADDFVVATGVDRSLREFVTVAFESAGIGDWEARLITDKKFMRPSDLPRTVGNPEKAKTTLDWRPRTEFRELVQWMVDYEVHRLSARGSVPLVDGTWDYPRATTPRG